MHASRQTQCAFIDPKEAPLNTRLRSLMTSLGALPFGLAALRATRAGATRPAVARPYGFGDTSGMWEQLAQFFVADQDVMEFLWHARSAPLQAAALPRDPAHSDPYVIRLWVPAGSHYTEPAGEPRFARSGHTPAALNIADEGPCDNFYVDPRNQPR